MSRSDARHSPAITDQTRRLFDVVPEELLTDEVRDLQLSAKVDDCAGFEYARSWFMHGSRSMKLNVTTQ
jgi:hypothetical protein